MMKVFRNTAPRKAEFQAATPHKTVAPMRQAAKSASQTLLIGLVSLTLLVGPALLSACTSQKELCPAYKQQTKREALPY